MKDYDFGLNVRLVHTMEEKQIETVLHNVSEIHFKHPPMRDSIAFESDEHGTGLNLKAEKIIEFETEPAPKIYESFID